MNSQLHRTRELIAKHGFRCIRSEIIPRNPDYHQFDTHLEWWAGPKGVIVLEHSDPKDGVASFGDWPLGHAFEELEKAVS